MTSIPEIDAQIAALKAQKKALKPRLFSPGIRSRSFRPEGQGQRQRGSVTTRTWPTSGGCRVRPVGSRGPAMRRTCGRVPSSTASGPRAWPRSHPTAG